MLQDGFDFDRKALNGFSKLAEQVRTQFLCQNYLIFGEMFCIKFSLE